MRYDDSSASEHRVDLAHPPRDIFEREAVKSKTAQAEVVIFAGQGVGVIHKTMSAMERRIETRDLRHMWKRCARCVDASKIVRLVQRRQRSQLAKVREHCVVYDGGSHMRQPAVHDAVANRSDQTFGKGVLDPFQDNANGLLVIDGPGRSIKVIAVNDSRMENRLGADAFDLSRRDEPWPSSGRSEKGEFNGGGTRVDRDDAIAHA
jgi:hypothetical protein